MCFCRFQVFSLDTYHQPGLLPGLAGVLRRCFLRLSRLHISECTRSNLILERCVFSWVYVDPLQVDTFVKLTWRKSLLPGAYPLYRQHLCTFAPTKRQTCVLWVYLRHDFIVVIFRGKFIHLLTPNRLRNTSYSSETVIVYVPALLLNFIGLGFRLSLMNKVILEVCGARPSFAKISYAVLRILFLPQFGTPSMCHRNAPSPLGSG